MSKAVHNVWRRRELHGRAGQSAKISLKDREQGLCLALLGRDLLFEDIGTDDRGYGGGIWPWCNPGDE